MTFRNRFLLWSLISIVVLLIFGFIIVKSASEVSLINELIQNQPTKIKDSSKRIEMNILKMHREMKDLATSLDAIEMAQAKEKVDELEIEVYEDLSIIHSVILGEEGNRLYSDAKKLFDDWKPIRDSVIDLYEEGKLIEARHITKNEGATHVVKLEVAFRELYEHGDMHIISFMNDVTDKANQIKRLFMYSFLAILFVIILTYIFTLRKILIKIRDLKYYMNNIIKTKNYEMAKVEGVDEVSDLGDKFSTLISVVKEQIQNKNSISDIQYALSENSENIYYVCKKYVEIISTSYDIPHSCIYLYEDEKNKLKYIAGFSSKGKAHFKEFIMDNEGIAGQVIQTKKVVSIGHINKGDYAITSAGFDIYPKYIYAFPIISGDDVLGYLELGALNPINSNLKSMLELTTQFFSISVLNAKNTESIKKLLYESKEMNDEIKNKNNELEQATHELENVNRELEQSSQEIEMVNKELEQQKSELVQKSDELENANKLKNEFLSNVSHELRTPLNAIILISDMLMHKKDLDKQNLEKIEIIQSSGTELLEHINNLLDISRIESGEVEVFDEWIETSVLTERINKQFIHLANKKKINFKINDEMKCEIETDTQKLNHILVNFLSNAFKFTEEGYVELGIDKSDLADYEIRFYVKDTGIGIEKEKLKIIFEKFIQADGTISREYGGTGLGLSIASKMANLIGGEIRVESERNNGSTFYLYLSQKSLRNEKKDNKHNNKIEVLKTINDSKEDSISDKIDKNEKSILIIEDDLEFAKEIKKHVNKLGYNILHAKNGNVGLHLAQTNNLAGIILDLMLPDINGTKVLKILKTNPNTRAIPVHVLSVKDPSQSIELKKSGAIGYTQKSPYIKQDIDEVVNNIEHILHKAPKKILIAEDEKAEIMYLKELMENWEIEIKFSDTVSGTIALIDKEHFNAIVVDLGLKDGLGWDICKYVKENKLEIPIIIYTAKTLTEKEYNRLEKYSDSIILKSATSYGNLLEEISIFIHKVYSWQDDEKGKTLYYEKLQDKKVMICDDDARNVFVLSSLLEEFGMDIVEAYNGEEAVKYLESNKDIDILLLDIMMPKMDGIETMNQIRNRLEMTTLPIIALTAKAMKGDREACLKAGANDYLSKPIDMDILLNLINMWL